MIVAPAVANDESFAHETRHFFSRSVTAVARIHERMRSFRDHRGAASESRNDEFGSRI
jgi:hypothetical protein